MKRILKYLFLLLLICPIYTYAEEIDINKVGKFNMKYFYGTKGIDGEIKIYKVANINKDAKFTFTSEYSLEDSLEVDTASKWNELAQKISNYIKENNINESKKCTTQEGTCQLSDLGVGLYLVTSSEVTEGNYTYSTSPSLISMPNYNELDKVYVYDQDIILKTEAKNIKNTSNEENNNSNNNNNTKNVVPKTIDNIYEYLIIFIVSIVVVVLIILYINKLKKKEKKNEKDN